MKLGKWIVVAVVLAALFCLPSAASAKTVGENMVSPALMVIAQKSAMAKAVLRGEEIGFEAEDFERALNVSSVTSITVTELPERTDGILYLGGSEVAVGQTVTRSNIPYLTFVFASEEITSSTFRFSTNLGAYDIACSVYSLAYENRSPVVSSVPEEIVSVGTYKDVSVYGILDAYDPDGDALRYEIVNYPQNGLLVLTDPSNGAYRYKPTNGFSGEDGFRYVAVDRYGNYSASVWVSVKVSSSKSALVYEDLDESKAHVAAIAMTECGVMASSELDGNYYFNPTTELTRAEFLVMAMKTMGIQVNAGAQETVFADNAEIPSEYRGHVNVAQKMGYVCGRLNSDNQLVFCPNDAITRYEAAAMLYQMCEVGLPVISPVLVDSNTVPSWAKEAVYAMTAAGILDGKSGYIAADSPVTREQAAQMLYKLSSQE